MTPHETHELDVYRNLGGRAEVYYRDVPDEQNKMVRVKEVWATVYCTEDTPQEIIEGFIKRMVDSALHATPSLAGPSFHSRGLPTHGEDPYGDEGFSRKREHP